MSNTIKSYIIAARRSALGRVGGLHGNRRVEALAAPVIEAALQDAGVKPSEVDEIIVGNTTAGANPARLIGLASGLNDTTPAITLDRDAASGLDAVVTALEAIDRGHASIIVAGGIESLSTAPWRLAKPTTPYQTPRFLEQHALTITAGTGEDGGGKLGTMERLARLHQIQRAAQDHYAARDAEHAQQSYRDDAFKSEIVPLRVNASEFRDESAQNLPSLEQILDMAPLNDELDESADDGSTNTLTSATIATPHDGAAFAVIVNQEVYERLGSPAALMLVASASAGSKPGEEAHAPMVATQKLKDRLNGHSDTPVDQIEFADASAGQALAFSDTHQYSLDRINPKGGEISRGHAPGASGAILVTRLFTDMVKTQSNEAAQSGETRLGLTVAGAAGGLATAAAFQVHPGGTGHNDPG